MKYLWLAGGPTVKQLAVGRGRRSYNRNITKLVALSSSLCSVVIIKEA